MFGLTGKMFFWELASLIDIMLLGHWIEMRSVMGASRALEELARLMPSDAHKLMPDGSVTEVPLDQLFTKDRPVIFAFHAYPWLIHRVTYRRTNHENIRVRGYKEEGTITTPST